MVNGLSLMNCMLSALEVTSVKERSFNMKVYNLRKHLILLDGEYN
jgi:hypothetical protein